VIIKTSKGEVGCPDEIDNIDKLWAEHLYDRCRVDELYHLIAAIRSDERERYYFDLLFSGQIRPQSPEPASEEAGRSGESGSGEALSGVPGSVPACYWRERADEA
jgi:hypothetical protein